MSVLHNNAVQSKAPSESQFTLLGTSTLPIRRPPPDAGLSALSPKDQCLKIVGHEFRALQLDSLLTKMSVFDLIDHCAALFEELTQHLSTERGFHSYVRSFLIFNYFVNTFIMVHFNGFAKFMESLHQDFIIYLNLYNFFRRDDILGPNAFDVDLADLRLWIIQYLRSKDLLSFDVDLLFGWLNDYIDYLKHKDDEDTPEDSENELSVRSATGYYKTDGSRLYSLSLHLSGPHNTMEKLLVDDDIFDFNSRFPDVSPSGTSSKNPPYPVGVATTLKREKLPYPVHSGFETSKPPPAPVPPVPSDSRSIRTNQFINGSQRPRQASPSNFAYGSDISRSPLQTPPQLPPHLVPNTSLTFSPSFGRFHSSRDDRLQNAQQPVIINQTNGHAESQTHPNFPLSYGNGLASYQHRSVPNVSANHHGNYNNQYGLDHYNTFDANGRPVMVGQPPNLSQPMISGQINGGHITTNLGNPNGNYRALRASWMRDHSVCGLKNMGSSCYINSVTQVLFGLGRLNSLFLDPNSDLSHILRSLHKKPKLVDSVANLLSTFTGNGGANIAPTKFLRVLSSLKPEFNIPFEQQDAQEFLLFMIDKLHAELARKPVGNPVDYILKWDITVNPKDRDEYLKWYHELVKHEGESPINDMCQGHVQSKLICNTCGHNSISYSPFSILSLPIPNANSNGVDLTDCLRYYTQDEVLSGENAWRCPKCNKDADNKEDKENPMDVVFQPKKGMFSFSKGSKSSSKKILNAKSPGKSTTVPAPLALSVKQLSFIKLPPVLFIHLSRFSMYNLTDKLHTDIIYPLRLKFNHQNHDIVYNLTGLINHYGNLKSGHYTSLVNKASVHGMSPKDPLQTPGWCYFDDDQIRINVPHGDVNSNDSNKLRSRDVYVLCYERQ